ncbi:hypothetical protein ACNQ1U_01905 [Mycoplasma sp. 653B]|uniref:hypothetical protein n=1 Tax=Mycoplasma sp. 653B TaxID=3401677 RepID=UPI003AAA5169
MSEKNKNGKAKKILFTVAATTAALTSPLLILAGNEDTNTVSTVNVPFAADTTIDVNSYENRDEYNNVANINFGMGKAKDKVMNYDDAVRTVKFTKAPSKDDWNKSEQTWELMYESGTLSNDIFNLGTWWQNEYAFGQRTYGFALSSDLEIVPGTLSIKMEYMGTEDDNHTSLNETERRRNMAYPISGKNPDNDKETLNNKYGTYIKFEDPNGYFNSSAEQEFGQNSNLIKDNFWIKNEKFDFNKGSQRKGNWMYNWWNTKDPNNPEPFKINTIPEYEDLGSSRPAIDGIEFLTSDAKYKDELGVGFTPSKMDVMMSMTQIPDQDKSLGYSRYFGIGLNTDKYLKELSRPGDVYNSLASDTGSIFLIHYFTGLEKTRYASNKRPVPLVTIKFKTRRKYDNVLINIPEASGESKTKDINAYLSKVQTNENHSSFVSGLFHADKDQSGDERDPYSWWAFDKTIENTKYSKDKFNTWYRNPSGMGNVDNQYTGVATSYASRTFKRSINLNLTEKINLRDNKNDVFPKITGFDVLKDGQKIDTITLPWRDEKNNSNFLTAKEYKTALKNYMLNIENLNDLNGLTLVPVMADAEGRFKWNTSSTVLKFDNETGILSGGVTYNISDEQLAKEKLEDELSKSRLPEELLYEGTNLTPDQLNKIKSSISWDYWRPRFDGKTQKSENTTLYNNFWLDFIKQISKLNYDRKELDELNLDDVNTVNYRLASNKEEFDKARNILVSMKSHNFNKLNMTLNGTTGEVEFSTQADDPRNVNYTEAIAKYKQLLAELNGQENYNATVAEIDKKLKLVSEHNDLYQLAKLLDNNKSLNKYNFNGEKALLANINELKEYLKNTLTYSDLTNFNQTVEQYINNFARTNVIEELVSVAGDESSSLFKQFAKWFGYDADFVSINSAATNEFKKLVSNSLNINNLVKEINDLSIENNEENKPKIAQLKTTLINILYLQSYYSDFNNMDHWYDLNGSELPELTHLTFKYKLTDEARTYISDETKILSTFTQNLYKNDIYGFIKHKNEAYAYISRQLNSILTNNEFDFWKTLAKYAKAMIGEDVYGDDEFKKLIDPLKLAVSNINSFENLVILSDTGFNDVIYSYIFNNWLIKNNKYGVEKTADYSKNAGLNLLNDKLVSLASTLKAVAQPEMLNKNSLANSEQYLEAILKSKVELLDSKSAAQALFNTSNGEVIKSKESLAELLNENIQFNMLKQSAEGLKEKLSDSENGFKYIKNASFKSNIIDEINSTIAPYVLSNERINNDKGSDFYETNAEVKKDWETFGDFYKLNRKLNSNDYAKELGDIKLANNAFVDQYYKSKYDQLSALNDAIKDTLNTINGTALSQESKEALNNLAQQSTSIEGLNAIKEKLDVVVKAYNDLDTDEKAANNVKAQAENNYKFASNEPKSAFDTLLASLSDKKAEINKTKVTTADDLDKVVNALNTLSKEITTKQEALDGVKQLKDLQDKVTVQDLPAYTEDQIQGLKDALAKTADLDAAKAKVTQYSEFNSQVAAAKELVAKFDEITRENKYINATSDKKSAYDTSAKALKQFVEGYQAKIEEYKTNNSDTWTNNLPTMKSDLSKIVEKYNQDLKALDGDKALEEAKKAKNDLIDKFTNISDSLKAAFKEKINQETTTQNVDAKFNELKDIDAAYGTTINPLTKLQGLINSDKFEALNGEPEYNTIKEDLAKIEKNFDNKKGNVDLTKEKVEELLSQINSDSKTIETKYEEFNKYCEEQKNKIKALEWLANRQKETLQNEIDSDKNKAQVNATVEKATKLNASMKNLRDIYAEAEKVKTTPKYLNASDEPKTNFDQQISDELVNPDEAFAPDPSMIDDIAETLKDAIDRLDGDNVLDKAKEDANKEIDKLTNLSETQKAAVKAGISSANEVKDINDLVNKAKTFDKSIQDLKDQVATDTNNKQTTKYQQADKKPKEAYDAKAQAVADKLKELQELSLDNNLANATAKEAEGASAIQAAKEAYAGLNGDNKLADAKSKANGALDALTNLNSQVIDNFKQEIAQANDVTTVNNVKDKAVAQNTLVGDIVSSLSQAEALKQNNSVYNKATQEQKEALENAIKDVKDNILDSSAKKMKPNDLTDQLQAKKDAIDNAIKAINKLSGEITEAQNKAKEEINKLQHLTQAQKDALNAKVDAATSIQAIDDIVTEAKTLDTATRALREAIAKGNEVDKGANNYKFADEYNQKHFDAMAIEAKAALESGLADKNAEVINSIAQKLMQAIEALNGDAKLNANRDAAKETVDKLDNLTKEQKDSIKDKITNAKDDAEVKNLTAAAEKLNKALKEAQEAAKTANTAKDSDNYKQASQTPKNNFDSKKQALDSEISTAKGTNTFENADAINKLADELTKATENSNTAKDALDGDKLLAAAKAKAQSALDNAKHLSEDYKKALQEQINNAKEVAKLEELATNIPTLDTAAGKLAEAATKLAQAIADPEYANASEDTKAKVAQAQNQNKDLLTNSLLNNGKDNTAIQAALEANNAALEAIKADKEALATARTKANEELAKLTNLSKAQKDDITSKINEANTVANVTAVLDNAKVINTKMGELIEWNQKIEEAKGQTKYTQASDNVKKNFDTIYNAQKNIWLKDNQVSIDPSVIDGVINGMKGVYNTLDGDKRLSKAKEDATKAVEALTNIDQKAKDAAKDAITKTQTVDAANAIAAKETALDKAVADANAAVQVAKALKETPQYKEATDNKQQAFDNAIKALEDVVKTAKEQANLEQVETDTNDLQTKKAELEKAQSALDGNTKLQAAKEAAKTVIDGLENIDTPVKENFKNQLADKTSTKDIESVVDKAKATNTATKDLIQKIAKANELINKADYNVVPEDKKQALQNALQAAKDLLTTQGDKLKAPTEVLDINNAKENLSQAIIQASGQADEILKAQKAAKDEIDKLTNLTDQQKEALKHQVSSAVTNEGINAVVEKAKELDKVTKDFKDAINSAKELDKNSDKYKYADENKQKAFDNDLKDAEVELAKGLANKDKDQIKELSEKLAKAQGDLNGESKLADAKKDAQDKVQNLTNLSDEQKDAIKSAINNATSPEAANAIANKAAELDQAIAKAKEAQKAAAEVKATPKYTEASDATKNPFDTNANKLDGDLTNATTTKDLATVEKLDNLVKALTEDTTKTNDANAALDGQSRLDTAKAEANGVIAGASQLSPQAANTFKDTVDKAQTIAAVNEAKEAAKTAQEAAKALVDNLDKVNTALQNAGSTLDAAIAKEASEAKDKANEFLEDNKLKQGADVAQVNKAAAKLAEVLGKIKANVDALKGAQNDAIDEINKLPNLSSTQKEALINEVKAAQSTEAVNNALTKAKELDKAIGQLKDNLASIETTKASDNYKLADVDKKNELDKVASDKDNIMKQAAAALDKSAIEALNSKINTAKDALNGDNNKQAAKEAIDALNNLSSNQKSAAKDTLNQAQDKAQLDAKVQEAKDLDSAKAKLQVAKESLDALINQFTKPNNISEAALSSFYKETKVFADNKKALEDAKEAARVALEATTLNATEVANALAAITKAKETATNTIETTVANNSAIVSAANIANFDIAVDKEKATAAATKAVDKNANIYEDVVAAREVQHLAALDKFAKFQAALPQELKASTSFNDILDTAKRDLNNSNSKASDDEILAKIQHQLLKDKLALAYDAAAKENISEQIPAELKAQFDEILASARDMLSYHHTDVNTPKATYDDLADQLYGFMARNELANVIAKAQLAPKSSQLAAAIAQGKEALNNKDLTQKELKAASDKLVNETNKAKLYQAINNANDFVKELQEGNKEHHSALRDRIVNTLSNEDIPTAVAAANKHDTEAGYNTAAAALDNAVANAKKTIENVFKTLEELRDKIANMPQDQISAPLKEQLAHAQTIKKDSGVVAIENALENLQHKYATNELDKAIAAAPTINDKYATLVPSIVDQSQTVSNNPQASTQEIATQLAKQLLNNAKGNALNTLAGLNNLNNAQASALANAIAQAQDANQVANELKQAQDLDKAMATLKDTYAKVDEAYKSGTNLPYEAFFIPADKLAFVKDAIAKAGKVTPETGEVYLDNLPAQIDQLNSDLNTALDSLGQGKGQAKAMEEEFNKLNNQANTLSNNLQVNSNKLFNSPQAIQTQVAQLQGQIKDLSDKYFNNHAAYMQEGNAKLKQLVDQLSNLNDQVDQFSPQVFTGKDSKRITQAQDVINNNSDYTSDVVANNNLDAFNRATTYQDAIKSLNDQVATNNDLKAKIAQFVANLTDSLNTKKAHPETAALLGEILQTAKPEIVKELTEMMQGAATILVADQTLKTALNTENAGKAFKDQINLINNGLNALPQVSFAAYPEFDKALNTAKDNVKDHANGIKQLIQALDTRNSEELAQAIQLLNKVDKNNAKLAGLIQEDDYIGILNNADNKAITKDDLATVDAMKNSSEYQLASPAIQDLLNQDLSGKKPWAWWPIAVAASAVAWIAGLLAILLKRK